MEEIRIISKLKPGPKPEIVAFMEGREVQRLMRAYKVTIRELSLRMGITMKRIRQIRKIGLEGRELIRDWVQGILGEDPGPLSRCDRQLSSFNAETASWRSTVIGFFVQVLSCVRISMSSLVSLLAGHG
jgi:hypothetical protein